MTESPETDRTPASRTRTALSVALVAWMYLWVFPYHAVVNNPNENVRVYMTVAVVDDHTFAINRVESTWGYVNDKSVREGRLYSSKAPGSSYVGVPFYWLLTKVTGRHALPVLTPPRPGAPPPRPPLDRTALVYFLRLTSNVLPALLFAWFWHRFLDRRTRSPALRDAAFFSTMLGSSIFAYSEVFAGHAQNALCLGAAIMALISVREGDDAAADNGRAGATRLGAMFLAGLFGAGCTMFEYPAGIATLFVALWIASVGAARRRALLYGVVVAAGVAGGFALKHRTGPALGVAALGAALYVATLSLRSTARLVAAALGGAIPTGLTLLYHKRCFGDAFKPGYSFLENPTFREETNQGFFGATQFSWEAGLRLWLDPAFGLIPSTPLFLVSLVGFGAYFAWGPEAPSRATPAQVWQRRGATALFVGFAALAAVKAAKALHGAPLASSHAAVGPWLAALVFALVALVAAQLPRPRRPDASLVWVMALSALGLSRLIGAMNNWRGGWQVGLRYLVTLVPVLVITALAGLEAMRGRGEGARARAVTVFAGGATLAAMALTGAPSAWFPHIPLEFSAPLFEMILPLLRGGYVPHNAGHLAHLTGHVSMAGFYLAALGVAWVLAKGDERRPVAILAHAAGVFAVAALLLVPQALSFHAESIGPTRYVLGAFEPHLPTTAPASAPPPGRESPAQSAARARALAARGEQAAAMQAWLKTIRAAAPARP